MNLNEQVFRKMGAIDCEVQDPYLDRFESWVKGLQLPNGEECAISELPALDSDWPSVVKHLKPVIEDAGYCLEVEMDQTQGHMLVLSDNFMNEERVLIDNWNFSLAVCKCFMKINTEDFS